MRLLLLPSALLFALVACSRAPSPSPPPPSPNPVTPASSSEVAIRSGELTLHGWVFRPEGRAPFPALVYNHGSEKDPSLDYLGEMAAWFQEHGYVLVLPFRRGSGGSDGKHWEEGLPPAEDEGYWPAALAAIEKENDDVASAIAWTKAQPYVDGARVSVAGCSFGGIHTLLAAERPQGLHAAVDFAGASMSWASSPLLQQRLGAAVQHAQVPVFFVQAQNDFDTTPSLTLSQEMDAAHEPNQVEIFPPHGKTHMAGHAHFCNHGMAEWGDDVLAFLDHPPQ
jgi:carboxymethylenebutenolidase